MKDFNERFRTVYKYRLIPAYTISNANIALNLLNRSQNDFFGATALQKPTIQYNMHTHRKTLQQLLESVEDNGHFGDTGRRLLNEIKKMLDSFYSHEAKYMALIDQGKLNQAQKILHKNIKPEIIIIENKMQQFLIFSEKQMSHFVLSSDHIYGNNTQRILLVLVIIFGLGILLSLFLSTYLERSIDAATNKRKQAENKVLQLSSELIKSQEKEKQKISKDLHDSVGQSMVAAKINFNTYIKNPRKFKKQFSMGMSFLTKASKELREIYTGIYPSILTDFGLAETIKWYAKNFLQLHNIQSIVEFNWNKEISHDLKVNLYRIVQELFSNIIKYSRASKVTLRLSQSDEHTLQMCVEDNGIGFSWQEVEKKGAGFGLVNIKQRVHDFGGSVHINSQHNKGTQILIRVPI